MTASIRTTMEMKDFLEGLNVVGRNDAAKVTIIEASIFVGREQL